MKKVMHRQIRLIKNWVVLLTVHVSFPVVLATVSAAQYDLNIADSGDCGLRQGLILLCSRFFPTAMFL